MELNSRQLFGNNVNDFNLYPHQADATQWIRTIMYNVGDPRFMKGGILADDMGFGKTRITAASIAASPVPTTLVLCPPSTRYEWITQLLKCVKDITIYTIEGDKYMKCFMTRNEDGDEEPDQRALDKKRGEDFIEPAILVCNYQLISAGVKNNKLVTDKVWYNIFIDEAHFLRTKNDTWKKLNDLKQPMSNLNGVVQRLGCRFLLSGTPLQMGLIDVMNMFNFIDERFMRNNSENECKALIGTNLFRRNRNQLLPSMKDFMKYPKKDPVFHNIRVALKVTPLSQQLEKLSYPQIVEVCRNDKRYVYSILNDERSFLIAKTSEAKAYNMNSANGSFTESEEFRNMISCPYITVPNFISNLYPGENFEYKGTKSKLDQMELVLKHRPNNSFVIFYHFDNIAYEIKKVFEEKYPQYTILKINGKVASDRERYNIVQKANRLIDRGHPVVLLSSTKATSEGMNYQKFSKVMSFDPEYNQKTEEQARSRVQRIGQENEIEFFEITIDDFEGYYGTISVDRRIQGIRDERTHLSDIIDMYNAAFAWKRYKYKNAKGQLETGIYFGDQFEKMGPNVSGGPDSIGPNFITEFNRVQLTA